MWHMTMRKRVQRFTFQLVLNTLNTRFIGMGFCYCSSLGLASLRANRMQRSGAKKVFSVFGGRAQKIGEWRITAWAAWWNPDWPYKAVLWTPRFRDELRSGGGTSSFHMWDSNFSRQIVVYLVYQTLTFIGSKKNDLQMKLCTVRTRFSLWAVVNQIISKRQG